jgi:hypothetical protein
MAYFSYFITGTFLYVIGKYLFERQTVYGSRILTWKCGRWTCSVWTEFGIFRFLNNAGFSSISVLKYLGFYHNVYWILKVLLSYFNFKTPCLLSLLQRSICFQVMCLLIIYSTCMNKGVYIYKAICLWLCIYMYTHTHTNSFSNLYGENDCNVKYVNFFMTDFPSFFRRCYIGHTESTKGKFWLIHFKLCARKCHNHCPSNCNKCQNYREGPINKDLLSYCDFLQY